MHHRRASSSPARGFRASIAAMARRLRAPCIRRRADRRPLAPGGNDTYLGPDGRPYERISPWG